MPRRRARIAVLLAASIAGMVHHRLSAAEPVSGSAFSPSGSVRLASGVAAHYQCHGLEGAPGDLIQSGDAVIARNDSGHLLRFDLATLRLTRVRSGPVPVTCLVRGGDGTVLAGFADGRIARIDPTNLTINEIARVSGKVQWAGIVADESGRPATPRVVAVVEGKKWGKDFEGRRAEVPCSFVEDPARGKTYDPGARSTIPEGFGLGDDLRATAFLLDRQHRLWIAANLDEWGSWCSRVDLETGKVHPLPGPYVFGLDWPPIWYGFHGFIELSDGQVWAYGGISHMEHAEGFISRMDTAKPVELYRRDNRFQRLPVPEKDRKPSMSPREARAEPGLGPPPADHPCDRITWIGEEAQTGALLVMSFTDIFRTDPRLARWERIHKLKTDYSWEDPGEVDSFPAIRSVLPIKDPGRPTGLLFANRPDGLVRLDGGRETGTRPLGADSFGWIAASSEGLLVFERSQGGDIWRYRGGAWGTVSIKPPYQPPPDAPEVKVRSNYDEWDSTCVLVSRDGSIITVSAASADGTGTRTTARWRGGKAEILGREVSSLVPSDSFLTPDGQIWNADRRILRRFVDGRWADVGTATKPRGLVRLSDRRAYTAQLAPVNAAGPPWDLVDARYGRLVRLSHGPAFQDARLTFVPLTKAGQDELLGVRDAIEWKNGELLLATDDGLKTVAVAGDRVANPRIETGGRSIARLARDGQGRLWLGGEGLAMLDADGRTLHPVDELPMIGRSAIAALAADPDHPDGVLAAVEGRGVVFVRVEANEGRSR